MAILTPDDLVRAAAAGGIRLSEPQASQLGVFGALLERWNRRINLTASQTLAEILERQVLDCLMVESLPWPGEALAVVDIGSGAGLPGLVLAIVHPRFAVTSLERIAKKATFQQEAIRTLGLTNVTLLREDAAAHAAGAGRAHYEVALARAFADLAETLPLAANLLKPGGRLRTYKGRKLPQELAAIPPSVQAAFAAPALEHAYAVAGTEVAGVVVEFIKR